MIKSKNVVKKLTTILFTLVAIFGVGLTNVNAETTTAEVNNYSDLTAKMNDNVTDVVKLTSDITLREDSDTTFSLEMSKTLDFNGFTLTVPEHYNLKLIYRNSLDLKFINSNSSKRAKLNLLTDIGYTPIYNEIMQPEYTVNFEMDGVDVEYIKDFYSFWLTAGNNRFNNVVFKNLKVIGFHEIVDTRAYKSVKFLNVTKESKNVPYKTYLINSSTLTVDDVIDADSIIEYSDREGTKIANRTATLDTIDAYYGPITVKAANSINEIRLVGDVQYGKVPAGILPAFNPRTTTDSITIDKTNSSWEYKMESGGWSGFGLETPVAYNDGKTDYGYSFSVKTNDGYQLDYSNLKVFYNEEEVTSSVKILKYPWGAYVTVDLGKAIGKNPTTHTVTFNSNGGTEIAPKEVVSGLKIKAPSTPTKDKYLFRGWYEDDTFSIPFDFNNTTITSDMTLYAKWEPANSINEIRLAGDFQYGKVPVGTLPSFNPRTTTDSITIDKANSDWAYKMQNGLWSRFGSETPTAVNDGKTNYGYDFNVKPNDGYQLASDLKVIYNGEDVTSTVKVQKYSWGAYVTVDLGKAIGTPVVYTITFNSNGGTSVESQNVNAGEKLTEPTLAPTREGFTFDGWYEDSTFSKKFDFNTPITNSMTLYAKWTENKYTITFDTKGGNTIAPVTVKEGEKVSEPTPAPTKEGFTFDGWYTDDTYTTKYNFEDAVTKNITLYAKWNEVVVTKYTVTFDTKGGNTIAPVTVKEGEKVAEPTTAPIKEGFTFDGWYTDDTYTTKYNFEDAVTKNITLYAKWNEVVVTKYTVTFDTKGGNTIAPVTVKEGEKVAEPSSLPTKEGFTFDGWYTDDTYTTKYNFEDAVTKNITLYAKWNEVVVTKYTVTFDTKGGNTIAPVTVKEGEKVAEPTTAPTKEGFTFDGWYQDVTLNTKFDFNTSVVSNLTLYAKWIENKYTVTFDANGGSGTMTPVTDLTGEYTLPANGFTAPTGKQFKGWSLTTDGAIVTKVDMTENKTVYAIWKDIIYSYEFLESTGEQTIDGKANSFKIVIDADETKFVSLEIDGVLYEKDVDYTVKHGSTIIEFTSTGLAKLNALSKGEHTVRVTFTDEVINGKITVNAVNPPIIPQNPDIDNPQTYDGIFTYITMFVVSILGLITAVIIGKKRTRTN